MRLRLFLLKRTLTSVPILFGVILILFLIFSYMGAQEVYSTKIPIVSDSFFSSVISYFKFVFNIFSGHWGYLSLPPGIQGYTGSVVFWVSVDFPMTFEMVLFSIAVALVISFPLGRYLGTHYHGTISTLLRNLVSLGFAMPAYMTGFILLTIFGKGVIQGNPLAVFPTSGFISYNALGLFPPKWLLSNGNLISSPTHMIVFDALIHDNLPIAWNALIHLVLPVTTLVISITGILTFMLQSGYADNMGLEYVRNARSKGLSEKDVILHHVKRNAVLPELASSTIMIAYLLSNIVMVEYVFTYPGAGTLLIDTIAQHQYYPTSVIIFLFAVIMIVSSIIVDIIYFAKNPLVRN